MAAKRYLKIFFGLWVGLIIGITSLNWLVDPYDMFSSPQVRGFNQEKPEADSRQRLRKAYGVSHSRPQVLILGSSRALAIAPIHEVWHGKRVFNLALASTSTLELYRYLQHANVHNDVREVVWGLDWLSYSDAIPAPDFVDARLLADSDGTPRRFNVSQYLRDVAPSLWSLNAVGASVTTLKGQPDIDNYAQWKARRDRVRVQRNGGNAAMFEDFETHMNESFFRPSTITRQRGHDGPGTHTWRAILRYAYTHNIKMRFFLSPEHARLSEFWRATGRWDEIDLWKQEVVRVLAEEAQRAGKEPFPLWDFSGYNSVTIEPVPPAGDIEHSMRWYWEDSHYTENLGYLIIDRMYAYTSHTRPSFADFGNALRPNNIDEHLTNLRAARADYVRRAAADVAAIEAVVAKAMAYYHSHP